jgi:hypothetical protein
LNRVRARSARRAPCNRAPRFQISNEFEIQNLKFEISRPYPNRFENRRKVAAYFGLSPTSRETGKQDDRKGHITRQGNRRIRWALCQAQWAAIRCNPQEKARHERLAKRNPKRRKVATVAGMRRLGIRLWHRARVAQAAAARTTTPSRPPERGKRQFALPAKPRKYQRRSPDVLLAEKRRRAV